MDRKIIMVGVAALSLATASDAFAEDAYIESDGTQSINTGYYINAKTKIEIDFQMTEITSQGRLWGQNGTGCGNMAAVYFGDDANNFKIGYGNASFSAAFLAANNLARNTIVYDGPGNKGYFYQNGAQVASCDLTVAHDGTATFPMSIFGQSVNSKGASANDLVKMKLYGFKVYEDDALVHDYAPAFRGSITGLVDTVTGTFLYDTRASGGLFTGSGNLVEMEDDPYIESNGTSAINLGVSASPKLHVEIDYALTDVTDPTPDSTSNHYQQRLFGEDSNSSTPRMSVYINGSKVIAVATGDGWDAKETGVTADFRRRTVSIDNVAGVRALMTGVTTNWSDTCTDVTKCATRPFALFGDMGNDDATSLYNLCQAKVYGCKIWSGGTLIRDLAPRCIGGTAGFEDLVTGRFYTCDGLTASANAATELSGASREGDAFVESDGSFFSVVNTYYFVKPITKIEIDYALAAIVSGAGVLGGYGANAGISTILWCNGTTKLILEMRDGNHDSTANALFSPDIPLDLARHTAVFDGPGRHLSLSSHDGTVETESNFHESWTLNAAQANWPVLLFGFATDVYGHSQQRAKARIYGVKFYENGSLVLSLTPAVKGGVAGFKDGAGNFYSGDGLIAGGAVETIKDDPYIENPDGGRFFDTGYYVTSNTCVMIDYMPLLQQTGQQFPFEAGSSGGAPAMYMRTYGNGSAGQGDVSYACGQSGFNTLNVPYAPHVRRQVTVDAYNLMAKVETAGQTIREATIPSAGRTSERSNSTLKLLSNSSMNANSCKARVYGVKIYEEGTLVRDYVPICQAGSYALLDKVQGKVLAKASNSREFAGHTANNDLDDAFFNAAMRNEDAYIESDGTQAINLGYLTTPNTRYEIDYAMTAIVGQNRPFGEAAGTLSAELYIQGSATGSGNVAFGVGETWKGQYTSMGADLNRHLAVLDIANHQCGYTGKGMMKFGTDVTATKTATCPMWLFAKGTSTSGSYANLTKMKLYAFRIFESGTLVHEYLPYKVGSTVGLYDTMTGDVVTSSFSGSNAFTYGGGLGYGKFAGTRKELVSYPENTTVAYSGTRPLSAYAPGAVAYKWTKNGEVVAGGENGELAAVWTRSGAVDTYTVTAIYSVSGVETEGTPVTFTVTNRQLGLSILLR